MAQNMSFLPEDYLHKRLARRTNVICLTLFGIVTVGLWAAFTVDRAQRQDVRDRLAAVSAQFEEAAKRIEQLEELQAKKQQWTRKAQVAAMLLERVPRTLVLAELVNRMPQSLSLLDFQLKTEVSKTTPPPVSRVALERSKTKAKQAAEEPAVQVPQTEVTLEMTGVAPTDMEIAEYITALGSHPMFTDVSLKYAEQSKVEEREMRKFALTMRLNQDIDFRDHEPLKVARDLKMDPMGSKVKITPAVPQATVPVTTAGDSH